MISARQYRPQVLTLAVSPDEDPTTWEVWAPEATTFVGFE